MKACVGDDLGQLPVADHRVLTAPRGRLTTADARALADAARELGARGRDVRLECAELEQIGGAALQVLLALALELEQRGASVVLANLAPAVQRTLALAGASDAFTCV